MPDLYNPYVGPRAFEMNDHTDFFGRDVEIRQLADLVVAQRAVLLYAQSGAGKTSLINAGLIPALERYRMEVLPVAHAGSSVLSGALLDLPNLFVFNTLSGMAGESIASETLTRLTLRDGLETLFPLLRRDEPETKSGEVSRPTLLILDQFEEMFTLHPGRHTARAAFFTQLQAALDAFPYLGLLLAMREEYIAYLDTYTAMLPDRLRTRFRLDLLDEHAALLAVQEPARAQGVDFCDAAAHKLVDDLRQVKEQRFNGSVETYAGQYVEPVQLQVVCRQAWERVVGVTTNRRSLTTTDEPESTSHLYIAEGDIEAVGDVDSALAAYYAETVARTAKETGVGERAIREWCEHRLITVQGLRRQVLRGAVHNEDMDNAAIALLEDAYLVRAEKRAGATWYELAHDRLVAPIRSDNAAWLEKHLSLLQRQAALWDSQKRPSGLLLRGDALVEAEAWAKDHTAELTSAERDFLETCRREQQRTRLIRQWAVAATILAIVVTILAVCTRISMQKADQERSNALDAANRATTAEAQARNEQATAVAALDVAEARRVEAESAMATAEAERVRAEALKLAAEAVSNLEIDPELSILLGMQAVSVTYSVDATVLSQAVDALQQALQTSQVQLTLTSHKSWVNDVAFSPDGTRLATASADGTAKVWDALSGILLYTYTGHTGWVHSVAFSPDGKYLATASGDKTAKIWDVATGAQVLTVTDHSDVVYGVAFSPDGTHLATASWDKTVAIWEVASDQGLLTLRGHESQVNDVVFSPDGAYLATASEDKTARIWDLVSGGEPLVLSGHAAGLYSLAFSPDGTRLATASNDKTVRIWDTVSGTEMLTLTGHTEAVHGVAFSPNGMCLATGSTDGTVKMWDLMTGKPLLTLAGHSNSVDSVAFNPDGTRLASASRDGTAKVWNALIGHTSSVASVTFSPDGTRLATASDDKTVRVWDVVSGRESLITSLIITGHSGRVIDVAFSPDGTHLVTASDDGTARVWDAVSGRPALTLTDHTGSVAVVAFSPDGSRLATAGSDAIVRIWDATTGQLLFTLTGHTSWIDSLAFSPDGTHLVTAGGDGTTKVWDMASRSILLDLPTGVVRDVAFHPDGTRFATANDDNTARIWDTISRTDVLTLPRRHSNVVYGVAFSPDGKKLATASWDRTVIVWDAASGEWLQTFHHTAGVYRVAFSPDGRSLATASVDNKVNVYLLDVEDLMAFARTRVTRSLTSMER